MILKWNKQENLFRESKGVILSIQAVQNSTETVLKMLESYYSNIQRYATLHSLFYLEIALHVSGGTSTHVQERKELYLQRLVFVTP
jgi:hypothetical protein